MTTHSPPSSSDSPESSAFGRLNEQVQRWVYAKGWSRLRPIQERAIPAVLDGQLDIMISAPTAGGKTEAAFLPIASLLASRADRGIGCLCISPLKALINDQYGRLEQLFESVNVPVHRWHGDVSSTKKRALLKSPSGLLLITPESLEALFVLHGPEMSALWKQVSHVVVDELHAFIGSERGRQLQSLLHRVEHAADRRLPRIGLSATLGDPTLAARYLRHDGPDRVLQIADDGEGTEIRLQLRGSLRTAPILTAERLAAKAESGGDVPPDEIVDGSVRAIADHLFKVLRGKNNLIFANSRTRVEELADVLRRRSEIERVPNEFLPHHGSLSKELREDVEALLKDTTRCANVVCTTTLEMGIDIGDIASIAQIGVPPSVASMRQRLGRSGRREGTPATMRVYIAERELTPKATVQDSLRAQIVQSIAMIDLFIVDRWCEPPDPLQLHLSTLVQQTLSLIAQHGGVRATSAYDLLCRTGPFLAITSGDYMELLRELGHHDVVSQTSDGELVLGLAGERIVDHYTFFSAFTTPEEYRIVAGDRELGSLPIVSPMYVGAHLIFAGRRWRVTHVEPRLLTVVSSPGGRPPLFEGGGVTVHSRVRQKMREVYESHELPRYLDEGGRRLLLEGRETFRRLDLADRALVQEGSDVLFFPWTGDRVLGTLALWLHAEGRDASIDGVSLAIGECSVDAIRDLFVRAVAVPPSPESLAARTANVLREKYDVYLPTSLLRRQYAARELDVPGAAAAIRAALDARSVGAP